eukprot:CAMPEP_0114238592 /NCGR_PEP_ID=MMETSP0058-20121206/8005_1 /TAXON_ID=36894 /ORGANISM="Pyramimonas parkeae, CCMP726" /LENGTH=169 /DNA_ID=CAMNT_0001350709 /DNA_START=113 /DNA_END=622 /DNA_ORIENTATION=-
MQRYAGASVVALMICLLVSLGHFPEIHAGRSHKSRTRTHRTPSKRGKYGSSSFASSGRVKSYHSKHVDEPNLPDHHNAHIQPKGDQANVQVEGTEPTVDKAVTREQNPVASQPTGTLEQQPPKDLVVAHVTQTPPPSAGGSAGIALSGSALAPKFIVPAAVLATIREKD